MNGSSEGGELNGLSFAVLDKVPFLLGGLEEAEPQEGQGLCSLPTAKPNMQPTGTWAPGLGRGMLQTPKLAFAFKMQCIWQLHFFRTFAFHFKSAPKIPVELYNLSLKVRIHTY